MNTSGCEVVKGVHEVCEGSPEAVDANDREGVSPPQSSVAGVPFGALHCRAAGVLHENRVASCGSECVDLRGRVLIVGADAGVSGGAHAKILRAAFWRTVSFGRGFWRGVSR